MSVSQPVLTHTHLTMLIGHRRHAKCCHGCHSDPRAWDRVSHQTRGQCLRQLIALQLLLDEVHRDRELLPVHLAISVQVGQTPTDSSGNQDSGLIKTVS